MDKEELIYKIKNIEKRVNEINELLISNPKNKELFYEYNKLRQILNLWKDYQKINSDINETKKILVDEKDGELKKLAKDEIKELSQKKNELEEKFLSLFTKKEEKEDSNAIMEIRQGAGGEESSLFIADLFRMYEKYAEKKNWKIEIFSSHTTSLGGLKEIIFLVKGKGAYGMLKQESGVHRVQRVPVTEASGRVHTSTATVCVLPEVSETEVKIDPKDIKIETFCARGAGGQNVNKVETAIRVTYLPENITVSCQDERSQYQNKERAMKILYARIYELKRKKQEEEIKSTRRKQIGEGERAEKIRTYNFLQNRITDHRINLTLYKLDSILNGELDELINELKNANKRESSKSH